MCIYHVSVCVPVYVLSHSPCGGQLTLRGLSAFYSLDPVTVNPNDAYGLQTGSSLVQTA